MTRFAEFPDLPVGGFIPVPGGRVAWRRTGHGPGRPLLVLHGGPGGTWDYLSPLARLGDQRPVIFYDQLGSGASDRPGDASLWRVERFVEEVAAVRDALGLTDIHLFGHSWGALLAAEHALAAPGGIAGLILASPCLDIPGWTDDTGGLLERLAAHLEALPRRDRPNLRTAYLWNHICRRHPWPEPLRRSLNRSNPAIYRLLWGDAEYRVTGTLAGYDLTPRLKELRMPTLLTCGRWDEATPERTMSCRFHIPGAEMAVFHHSAHVAHLEEPDEYCRVLADFLTRTEARRSGSPADAPATP